MPFEQAKLFLHSKSLLQGYYQAIYFLQTFSPLQYNPTLQSLWSKQVTSLKFPIHLKSKLQLLELHSLFS